MLVVTEPGTLPGRGPWGFPQFGGCGVDRGVRYETISGTGPLSPFAGHTPLWRFQCRHTDQYRYPD